MSVHRRDFLRAGVALAVGTLLPVSAVRADYWVPPQPYTPPNPGPTPNLANWLLAHPNIAQAIVWQGFPNGTVLAWPVWPLKERNRLAMRFEQAFQGIPSGLPLFPRLASRQGDYANPTDAYDFFLAYVGHILALEMRGDLAWSIAALEDEQQLEILFDGRQYFEYVPATALYRAVGNATLAPPEYVYGFLRANQMVVSPPAGAANAASARAAAYTRLVSWCGDKMSHFVGGFTLANYEANWQYRGPPPVARVIAGTVNASFSPLLHHWTAGCIGTAAFLRSVARAMNMAVEIRTVGQHTTARMMANDLYLSHGDDPYARYVTLSTAPVPASLTCPTDALFFDGVTFFNWYTPFSPADPNKNVGRRAKELAVAYLPLGLLDLYLRDQQLGYSHATGDVAVSLAGRYSVAELETLQLWQQMDAKIAAHGGAAAIGSYMAQVTAEKHV